MGTSINNGKTLTSNASEFATEARGLANDVSKDVKSKANEVKGQAEDFALQAKNAKGEMSAEAKKMAREYLDSGTRYV